MDVVANHAPFPQGFMLEDEGARLFAMTFGANLVMPGHSQAASRFQNIAAMRIVTLHAIHVSLIDRVMLRKTKLRLDLQVAIIAGGGVFSRVHDKLSAASSGFNMFASGAMTRFAAGRSGQICGINVYPAMCAGGKHSGDIPMALVAGSVPDKPRSFNLRRSHARAREGRTGKEKKKGRRCHQGTRCVTLQHGFSR
jgi:hypothetical protein